ncbi:30S ribosome-binding factor RbfA [Sediminicurvatus halobius]|uniref:Ribosome-binding factor A n=1 Tax=Sediminicurvatus halobius TaxID=2182432 RepID=A0A2U2N3B8_9GAMM|nr:30S ribosome-binding factor RbfA [Spiribacter halobius]PWG63567.1 30S ribosome-binding factor RbfA [Spiribacter halobius]UEX79554.1 30S ribosome-binding factor RbfA [Spiribacter halobius]
MPKDFPRTRRVADQVQRELAGLIRDEVRDPRVGSVTVSEVQVSRDLAYADVHVTGLGMDAEASREMTAALNHAAGFLRSQLARRLRLRTVPALRFRHDEAFDRGARLSRLIDDAVADDASRRDD